MSIVTSDYLDDFSTSVGTGFLRRHDADGKVWVFGTYTNDGVDDTPMQVIVAATGYSFIDIADGTDYVYVGVPDGTHTSGATGWIQIGGYCDDIVVTSLVNAAGHALVLINGTVETTSAAYDGNAGEFAVIITTQTAASTATDCMLNPEQILETT